MSAQILVSPGPPSLEGEAICVDCGHEWEAVVPVGTAHLDCPSCLTDSGRLRHPVLRPGEHWQCFCGCDLFRVNPTMIYCAGCGKEQHIP